MIYHEHQLPVSDCACLCVIVLLCHVKEEKRDTQFTCACWHVSEATIREVWSNTVVFVFLVSNKVTSKGTKKQSIFSSSSARLLMHKTKGGLIYIKELAV